MNIKIWDNGGETLDRYTIEITHYREPIREYYGMGPGGRGVNMFLGTSHDGLNPGRHWGKRVSFINLDADTQHAIMNRITG